jgi:hypothetical protein
MAYPINNSGARDNFTFKLATSTATAVASDIKQAIGKVVVITGNEEAGYGSAGDEIFGVIQQIERVSNIDDSYVISVARNQVFEDVACVGTETAGAPLVADGKGGVKLSGTSSAKVHTATTALSVDATEKTCTIYIG